MRQRRAERWLRTAAYTALALVAFAANSVLCRVALRQDLVDPATFSTIRLASGAGTLLLIAGWRQPKSWQTGSWTSAGLLVLYAVPFSFAYTTLPAGTGALILFGAVQVTMLVAALWSGERLRSVQWCGLMIALAGLVYLLLPGLAAPPPAAAALMGTAGVSWGIYSLRGRGTSNPLNETTTAFARAVPIVLVISLGALQQFHAEPSGVWLAVASGTVASGLGYVVWYAALGGLTATHAAVVQLAVPILAAAGGVIFLAETISTRLALSTIMVLGGIILAIVDRDRALHRVDPTSA